MCVTLCTDSDEDGSTNKQASTRLDRMCQNEFVQTDEYVQKKNILWLKSSHRQIKRSKVMVIWNEQHCSKRKRIRNRLLSFLQQIILSHEVASSPHKNSVTSVSSHNMCRSSDKNWLFVTDHVIVSFTETVLSGVEMMQSFYFCIVIFLKPPWTCPYWVFCNSFDFIQ